MSYPVIDPIAFHIGSWPVHWYGLMYLVGFLGGWGVLSLRLKTSNRGFNQDQLSDIVFFAALGAILGGRLGYMFFYDWRVLLSDPLVALQLWKGGMSFHGGLLGVLVALTFYARKIKKPFLAITDLISSAVPIGLGAGRIGNFINGELWGRISDVPWAVVFPNAGSMTRHPSQLYEFAMEGILLFLILWTYSAKSRPVGAVSGLFALCYGLFRCFAEVYREPDAPIGFLAFGWLTEGQLLSIPLIFVGIMLLVFAYKKQQYCSEAVS